MLFRSDGTGVFDVLMRANKAHLEQEFTQGRIKGTEYSTVYLGSLQSVLSASVQFLLEKDKNALQAELIAQQVELAKVEVLKANAQLLNLAAELKVLIAQECKLRAEYDVLVNTNLKTAEEVKLLTWKTNTEKEIGRASCRVSV